MGSEHNWQAMTDEEMVPFWGDTSHLVWEILYRRHNPRVFATSHGILGNDADAQDSAVETWNTVFQDRHKFEPRGPGTVRAWILTIARTTSLRIRTARNRHSSRYTQALDPAEAPAVEESRHSLRILDGLLDRLPPEAQMAFLLARKNAGGIGTHRGQDVATLLDLSGPPIVSRLLTQARNLLRLDIDEGPSR